MSNSTNSPVNPGQFIDWPGQSGKTYRYWFFNLSDTIKDVGGNYLFAKQVGTGFIPVYIGIADSLRNRLTNHERLADAKRVGANFAMGHTTPGGEKVRADEERDLILRWQPQLNTQHKGVS